MALKTVNHMYKDDKYMVVDKKGVICGGNAHWYIPFHFMTELTYPTIFNTRSEAELFIYQTEGE